MRPEGRGQLTCDRDVVAALKARIKATMILLVRRDMAVPPFVFERSVARDMDL